MSNAIFAQVKLSANYEASLGEKYDVIDAYYRYYHPVGDKVIAIKGEGEMTELKGIYIQVFDAATGKELHRNYYNDFGERVYINKVFNFNDKLYLLFTSFNKKTNHFKLSEIDIEKGTLGDPKELFSMEGRVTPPVAMSIGNPFMNFNSSYTQPPLCRLEFSEDRSKVLIYYIDELKNSSKFPPKYTFYVYDKELKLLWNQSIEIDYKTHEATTFLFGVLNDGKVFSFHDNPIKQKLELLLINDKGEKSLKKIAIDTYKPFYGFSAKAVSDTEIQCSGNYMSYMHPYQKVIGVASLKIDTEGKILHHNRVEFPYEIHKKHATEKGLKKIAKLEKKGKPADIGFLKLLHVNHQENGNSVYVMEIQTYSVASTPTAGPVQQTTTFKYNDVILAKFDAEGELLWMERVAKNQITKLNLMGIRYFSTEDTHYLLYLDHPDNVDVADNEPITEFDGKERYLTLCKIEDKTGKFTKELLVNIKDVNGQNIHQFHPYRLFAIDIEKETFMFEGYMKGKKDALTRIQAK